METTIIYNTPDDGCIDNHTATVIIKDAAMTDIRQVLLALSELTVSDFAKLASVSVLKGDDNMRIEKSLAKMCGSHSAPSE